MRLAIFDFDGTIYQKETFRLLMRHLKEHPTYRTLYNRFYRSILLPYISYKIKLYPEMKMKKNLMHKYLQSFKRFTKEELDEYFTEVAKTMERDLNREVVARMNQHKRDGYFIMIVSGTFTPLLEKVAAMLPVDHIIGTEVAFKNDYLEHQAPIDHVHASRKTELIRQFTHNQTIDWENSYAYGDSYSDLSVLQLVGHPVAVCPDEKLREVAENNEWEMID